jgi:hypothetical protein
MRLPALLIAGCLWWSSVAAAPAADPNTYTVGVEDYANFLPYSEYKGGVYGGLGRAILDAFARQNGITFRYLVLPLKRRDNMFAHGELDFAFPDNPNWVPLLKKGLRVRYAPMLEFIDGVMVRPEDLGKPVTRIRTLGIPLGFTPYPYQQLLNEGVMRLEESATYDHLYDKLIRKRVDAAYMNTRIASYYWTHVEHHPEAPVVFDEALPHAAGYWYLSSIKHPELISQFRAFLKANKALVDDLKAKYQF